MVVTNIIRHGHMCRTVLQVLLFTATMPEALQKAAAKWQRKPVSIQLAPGEMSISQTITQVHSHTAVVSLRSCADLSFHSCVNYKHVGLFSRSHVIMHQVARCCQLPCEYLLLCTLLMLYYLSLAVHAHASACLSLQ